MSSKDYRKNSKFNQDNNKKQPIDYDMDNPTIAQFKKYSEMLDDKNDRYERIVKASRDITIESKRIIFLLHTIENRKNNRVSVLQEAGDRLDKLCSTNFAIIALELVGRDNQYYQFLKAFSAGCQEFIEAYTYYKYLLGKELPDWTEVNEKLKYKSENDEEFSLEIVPSEFMLGLADFTGEIMRCCINSLGSGDIDNCFRICRSIQEIYSKFMTISHVNNRGRDFHQKTSTMRSSTLKCEDVCYNLKVRGTEGSKLVPLFAALRIHDDDVDEGIY